jgi:hypothetical protein
MITLEEIADDYLVIEIKRIEEESAPISWALKRHGPEEDRTTENRVRKVLSAAP